MRKLILTLVAVAFIGFVQAQSFRFSAGYGLPWIGQQIGTETSTIHTTSTDPTQVPRITHNTKNVKGSFGAGWNISGAYIYDMSKNVSLELGLSYLQGRKYTTESSYMEMASDVVGNSSYESETSQSKSFLFTPTFKFSPNKKRRRREVSAYFLAGPVLGKINFDKERKSSEQTSTNLTTENRTTKFRGGISVGVRGGVGVSVVMNRKFSLFSEVMFTGMNYYPKESEITRYTVNGEDNLSSLTENVRKTIYVNEVTLDSQQNANAVNSPGRSLKFPVAMSSVSLNVGVIIKPQ